MEITLVHRVLSDGVIVLLIALSVKVIFYKEKLFIGAFMFSLEKALTKR
jgi:hypothetical protein